MSVEKTKLNKLSTNKIEKTHRSFPVFKNRFATHKISQQQKLPGELGAFFEDFEEEEEEEEEVEEDF